VIARAYLVLTEGRNGKPRARRVTSGYPALDSDEAVVLLELDLPDDLWDAPLITVPVARREVAVAGDAVDGTALIDAAAEAES
jgi:hypothetical protein